MITLNFVRGFGLGLVGGHLLQVAEGWLVAQDLRLTGRTPGHDGGNGFHCHVSWLETKRMKGVEVERAVSLEVLSLETNGCWSKRRDFFEQRLLVVQGDLLAGDNDPTRIDVQRKAGWYLL